MSTNALSPAASAALDAVRGFLSTLLGVEVPLTVARAEPPADADGRVVLIGNAESGDPLFAVTLDEGWAPVFSEAMLGEALPAAEAADLLQEVAGQAYGAFRTALGAEGATPPAVVFAVAEGLPPLPGSLGALAFSWARVEASLGGVLLLPAPLLEAEAAPAGAPAAASTAAPPSNDGSGADAAPQPAVEVARATFDDFGGEQFVGGDGGTGNLDMLSDVELEVTVELGRRRLPLADVLRLTTGSIIELEKLVGQPLEVYANGRLIAEGEAVVIDEQFGVRVTSLASRRKPQKAFL
jgi:flagellar motor switch protein FliN/FliY